MKKVIFRLLSFLYLFLFLIPQIRSTKNDSLKNKMLIGMFANDTIHFKSEENDYKIFLEDYYWYVNNDNLIVDALERKNNLNTKYKIYSGQIEENAKKHCYKFKLKINSSQILPTKKEQDLKWFLVSQVLMITHINQSQEK